MSKETEQKTNQRLDWQIARLLLEEPALTNLKIGEKLEHNQQVIQRRRASMLERGILSRSTVVWDWEAIGLPLRFRIDIQIYQKALLELPGGGPVDPGKDKVDSTGKIVRTQEALAKFILTSLISYVESHLDNDSQLRNLKDQLFVEDVMILLGNPNADLSAIVRARSHAAILKFVTGGLRMMRAVSRTSTYQEAWSCREGNLAKYSNAISTR